MFKPPNFWLLSALVHLCMCLGGWKRVLEGGRTDSAHSLGAPKNCVLALFVEPSAATRHALCVRVCLRHCWPGWKGVRAEGVEMEEPARLWKAGYKYAAALTHFTALQLYTMTVQRLQSCFFFVFFFFEEFFFEELVFRVFILHWFRDSRSKVFFLTNSSKFI